MRLLDEFEVGQKVYLISNVTYIKRFTLFKPPVIEESHIEEDYIMRIEKNNDISFGKNFKYTLEREDVFKTREEAELEIIKRKI